MEYLKEAWKSLDSLNEDIFSFDKEGLEELEKFRELDDLNDEEEIIDPEAETEEDLKDSYVGKVIIRCNGCGALIYKDPSEIIIDVDTESANEDEECPNCNNFNGFKVVGEVSEYKPEKEEKDFEADDEFAEEESKTAIEETEEPLTEAKKSKDLWSTVYSALAEDGTQLTNPKSGKPLINKGVGYNADEIFATSREDIRYERDGFDAIKITKKARVGIEPAKEVAKRFGLDTAESDAYFYLYVPQGAQLNEDFQRVEIETDTEKMSMTSDENGKTTVTTEPKKSDTKASEEFITPVSDETKAEIEDENKEDFSGETEGDFSEEDIEEFDEESFDELGESYLKNVYDNVDSYKTSGVKLTGNSLMVEGIISFTSGKKVKTNFLFEAKDKSVKGKLRFKGSNKQITESKNPFIIKGSLSGGKLLTESLTYNYKVKGQKDRIYGTVKR